MTDVAPSSSVICDKGVEAVKRAMIERVAHSEEHFVHLRQRDEPDMSFDERLALVEKLLANNPGEFIARFGCTFTVEDLLYFDTFCSSDYIVNFWTREIRQRLNESGTKLHQTVIKNRRYEAMRQLDALGEYFSDEEMKRRDPLLYDEMIGQHLTDDEAMAMVAADKGMKDHLLSNVLLQHVQVMQNNELYERQKDAEESQMEEEDEESDDDEDSDDDERMNGDENGDIVAKTVSDHDKAVLRNEFIEIMKQRFLDGNDSEFNYSDVDNNADYDGLEQLSRDAEDKYFNDDNSDTSDVRSQSAAEYDF